MNISSQIIYVDESNFSNYFSLNSTEMATEFEICSFVVIIIALVGFPTNFYVIWLIVRGTGNGVAAEFFCLNLAVCEVLICMYPPTDLLRQIATDFWMPRCMLEGLAMTGRPLFQCLMCVERYLAVVHPVTFLKYKPLRYRVICCVIVWVAGFGISGISFMNVYFDRLELYIAIFLVLFFFFLSIQLFCSVAVLRALKQSGPGERGRESEQENVMKRRAFHLIIISTVTMVMTYIPYIILLYVIMSSSETPGLLIAFGYLFFTSAGLVQPLLFINRVEKLPFVNYR